MPNIDKDITHVAPLSWWDTEIKRFVEIYNLTSDNYKHSAQVRIDTFNSCKAQHEKEMAELKQTFDVAQAFANTIIAERRHEEGMVRVEDVEFAFMKLQSNSCIEGDNYITFKLEDYMGFVDWIKSLTEKKEIVEIIKNSKTRFIWKNKDMIGVQEVIEQITSQNSNTNSPQEILHSPHSSVVEHVLPITPVGGNGMLVEGAIPSGDDNSQEKKEGKTLSFLPSGDTKQNDKKLQLERSASSIVETHPGTLSRDNTVSEDININTKMLQYNQNYTNNVPTTNQNNTRLLIDPKALEENGS